jgi:hypothetical protein
MAPGPLIGGQAGQSGEKQRYGHVMGQEGSRRVEEGRGGSRRVEEGRE